MTTTRDQEEQDRRIELMQTDQILKQKQAFWETPRNIAILVTAVAAVAGLLGFRLGQIQPPPQTIIIQQPAAPARN
jgi:hypothetical protein